MAEMYTQLAACRAFTYNTIRAAERDDLTNHDCASLLLFVSEAATKVALEGIQILGGNGYSKFCKLQNKGFDIDHETIENRFEKGSSIKISMVMG